MAEILPGDRAPPSLPTHLIEEILVRVASPVDLARASAACTSFRNLVADATFLRRYRSLHPPLLLGIVGGVASGEDIESFHPAEANHPNALAAQAFAHSADFSFDYLPRRARSGWSPCHSSYGRVLLKCSGRSGLVLLELAVCDPLTRDYTLLPPIPESLDTSFLDQVAEDDGYVFDVFFVPSRVYEETQFKVICWMYCSAVAVAFVYSSISGSWTHTSISWDALGFSEDVKLFMSRPRPSYAYGCFYWTGYSNKLLKLDINRMEFSAVGLPLDLANWNVFVFEAGGGRFGMLRCTHYPGNPEPLQYTIRQSVDENVNGPQVETIIPLPSDYDFHYYATGVADGYIFLHGAHKDRTIKSAYFSLEIKTLMIERVCLTSFPSGGHIISYFGFPPFMSPRRI